MHEIVSDFGCIECKMPEDTQVVKSCPLRCMCGRDPLRDTGIEGTLYVYIWHLKLTIFKGGWNQNRVCSKRKERIELVMELCVSSLTSGDDGKILDGN